MHHVDEHPLVVLHELKIRDLGQRQRRGVRGLYRYNRTAVLRVLDVAERRVIGTGNTLERVRHGGRNARGLGRNRHRACNAGKRVLHISGDADRCRVRVPPLGELVSVVNQFGHGVVAQHERKRRPLLVDLNLRVDERFDLHHAVITVLSRLPAHVRDGIECHFRRHILLDHHAPAAAAVVHAAVLAFPEPHKLVAETVAIVLLIITLVQAVGLALNALPVLAAEPLRVFADFGYRSAAHNDKVRLLLHVRIRRISEQNICVHHLLGTDFSLHTAQTGLLACVKVKIQCRVTIHAGVAQHHVVLTFQLGALHHAVNALLKDFRRILCLFIRQKRFNLLIHIVRDDLCHLVMYNRIQYVHRDRPQVLTLESFPLLSLHKVLALLDVLVQPNAGVVLYALLILGLYPISRERDFLLIHRSIPPARGRCRHSGADC